MDAVAATPANSLKLILQADQQARALSKQIISGLTV
jgi:hypothetical protein